VPDAPDHRRFAPWAGVGSASEVDDGKVSATCAVAPGWRAVSAELDETGTFLTVLFEPTEGDPPA